MQNMVYNQFLLHSSKDSNYTPIKLCINDNQLTSETTEITNYFNDHFCSIGDKITSKLPYSHTSSVKNYLKDKVQSSMFLIPAIITKTKDYILDLNTNKAWAVAMMK